MILGPPLQRVRSRYVLLPTAVGRVLTGGGAIRIERRCALRYRIVITSTVAMTEPMKTVQSRVACVAAVVFSTLISARINVTLQVLWRALVQGHAAVMNIVLMKMTVALTEPQFADEWKSRSIDRGVSVLVRSTTMGNAVEVLLLPSIPFVASLWEMQIPPNGCFKSLSISFVSHSGFTPGS